MGERLSRFAGGVKSLGLRAVFAAYFSALAFFILWIVFNPSDFWVLMGTLLFTVTSAFIAMFRFSRDLERSTREQIFTLRDTTERQVQEAERQAKSYVEALRESSERETRVFEDQIGRTVERLDNLSLKIEAMTLAIKAVSGETLKLEVERLAKAEEALGIERDRLEVLEKQREAEQERLVADANEREEERRRLTPKVFARIDEHPYLLWMKDFWVYVRLSTPVAEARVVARPIRIGSGRTGRWIESVRENPSYDKELRILKLGDIGVRGVYDGAEIVIHILTKDARKFRGQTKLLFSQESWIDMEIEPVD